MADIQIRILKSSPDICAALSDMLIETVATWRLGELHASRFPFNRQKHSGATRWLPPTAASGSFSAPSTAKT